MSIIYAGTNGFFDEIAVPDVRAAQDELVKFMATRFGNLLTAIKEKKTLDDAIKNDLNAALKEFQQHFKSMKGDGAGLAARTQDLKTMPSLIDIRRRVRAVKSTQQITKAMKMVSSSKLRRAQERIVKSRPYAKEMLRVFNNLATRTENVDAPAAERRSGGGPHAADRDHRRSRPVRQLQHQRRQGGAAVHARAARRIRRAATWRWRWSAARAATSSCAAASTCSTKRSACSRTPSGRTRRRSRRRRSRNSSGPDISSVYLVYNEFKSVISQRVVIEKLLPIPRLNEAKASTPGASAEAPVEYLFEPDPKQLLDTLLPLHVAVQVQRALLESSAAEHAARMQSMDSATRNAKEMVDRLTLYMNKVRQAAITREIIEVVSGAQADS